MASQAMKSNGTKRTVCVGLPITVSSTGAWAGDNPLKYALSVMNLQMALIFTVTSAIHFIVKRVGVPKLVSEMLAGLILGPSLLGRNKQYAQNVFPLESQEILGTLSLLGYTLFLFLIGVKMDLGLIKKTGKKALAIGILSLLAPLVLGMMSTSILSNTYLQHEVAASYLPYVTVTHSLTPFPVIACLLSDLKILNSELGRLALSSAIVSDLFSVFFTTLATLSRISKEQTWDRAALDLVLIVGFVIITVFVFRPMMFWVVRQTPEGRPVKDVHIFFVIAGVLLCALFSNSVDQFVLFGPFIFGLAVPDGPPLGSAIVDKLDSFVSGILMPVFITTCALRTDLFAIDLSNRVVVINGLLVLITFLAKFAAGLLPALYCNMPVNDAVALALIMSGKGTVEMATYSLFRDNKTINEETFALMVITTILAAGFVPSIVKSLYDPSRKYAGYQKRNIMHSRHNAELRILACIHRPDNVAAVINLLDASGPSRESPINVHVLHLIGLLGRSTPVFISHQLQKKIASTRSYSENVILAFNHYERNNRGGVTIHAFTAISPPKSMHDDICTLALDKLVSIIVIPFHRKWAIDGLIESEDNSLRTLNCCVLDRAPCSVGILVDRGQLGCSTSIVSSHSSYSIAMIFFGGNDDREALTYAKRMAKYSSISLTVVQFIAAGDDGGSEIDKMIDNEVLKDVKLNNIGKGYVIYIEEVVKDGPETALIVRSMVDEYDLIVVGRRHNLDSLQTSGLTEWSEFPELGVIGDLLASSDLKSKASVLVVQQQQLT